MSDENIVFKGTGRIEALAFISAIRKKALANGKQRDYEWMADVASGCFEGEAVAWYESLDVEVQEDWTDLSRELLRQWSAEQHGDSPALAATVPGRSPSGYRRKQVSGVVKIVTDRGTVSYLSRTLDTSSEYEGVMTVTDEVDKAARVCFRYSPDAVHEIRFENDFPEYPWLGFHFSGPSIDVYSNSSLWAYLSPYQVASTGSILLPPNAWLSGPLGGHRVAPSKWRVERGGMMRPYVVDDRTYKSRELDVMCNMEKKFIGITHQPPSFLNTPKTWSSARLIFEPC